MMSLREVHRKITLRCAHCGHKFHWKHDNRFSFGGKDVYHDSCMSSIVHGRISHERLEVLARTLDLTGLEGTTVAGWLEIQADNEGERITVSNKTWRVFHDVDKFRVSQQEGDAESP